MGYGKCLVGLLPMQALDATCVPASRMSGEKCLAEGRFLPKGAKPFCAPELLIDVVEAPSGKAEEDQGHHPAKIDQNQGHEGRTVGAEAVEDPAGQRHSE
jgi:hypothetical protein